MFRSAKDIDAYAENLSLEMKSEHGLRIGTMYISFKKYGIAVEYLKEFLRLHPNHPAAEYALSHCTIELNRGKAPIFNTARMNTRAAAKNATEAATTTESEATSTKTLNGAITTITTTQGPSPSTIKTVGEATTTNIQESKKHACKVIGCGKTFADASNCRRHVRQQHGFFDNEHQKWFIEKYVCKRCETDFISQTNLRLHLKNYHDSELTSKIHAIDLVEISAPEFV